MEPALHPTDKLPIPSSISSRLCLRPSTWTGSGNHDRLHV